VPVLVDPTVTELASLLERGETTAEAIVEHYLDRIERIDRSGPCLRSVLEVNPDAMAIARQLDGERRRAGTRGPLHGVPVLVKANVDTGDRMTTTAGSLALAGHRARHDAFAVAQLRRAGAVILGKTNLSEWANFRSTRSASGWSSEGGQTRNPHALDRSPCGSSSGSGVAIAADLAAAAIGTETDGSITCPAAVNGIVGFKPTVGLLSRGGIIPVASSQDTAGPMTKSVEDAALLMDALVGLDPGDASTSVVGERGPWHFREALERGVRGARLGVARRAFEVHDRAAEAGEAALETLRELGAELVEGVDLGGVDAVRQEELTVLLYEVKVGIDAYLAEHPDAPVRSLADVVAFNREHAARVMPYFGQELFERALAGGGVEEGAYREARARCLRAARDEGIDRAMRELRLDAIVAPTTGPAWVTDPIAGDRGLAGVWPAAAIAGYPHVTVPAGRAFGLPIGVSFFAGACDDATVLALAHAFERAARARVKPSFAERVV
jgi:amidase